MLVLYAVSLSIFVKHGQETEKLSMSVKNQKFRFETDYDSKISALPGFLPFSCCIQAVSLLLSRRANFIVWFYFKPPQILNLCTDFSVQLSCWKCNPACKPRMQDLNQLVWFYISMTELLKNTTTWSPDRKSHENCNKMKNVQIDSLVLNCCFFYFPLTTVVVCWYW